MVTNREIIYGYVGMAYLLYEIKRSGDTKGELNEFYSSWRNRKGVSYTTDYVLDETFTLLFRRFNQVGMGFKKLFKDAANIELND